MLSNLATYLTDLPPLARWVLFFLVAKVIFVTLMLTETGGKRRAAIPGACPNCFSDLHDGECTACDGHHIHGDW
jgi:hypothetical protein